MADFSVPAQAQAAAEEGKTAKTFWQAGEYKAAVKAGRIDGLQTARVHPKFLHSNATSHEWTFGAIAELLDNSVDEIPNGCTHVHLNVEKDREGNPMLTVLDNGGGMDRHHLHRMMSFGMSDGKNNGDRIGQYGNGFKTSSVRLGADALVVTKKRSGEKSIGLLSFSFLKGTGAEDVIVPIVSWSEKNDPLDDGKGRAQSLEIITEWSQYKTEEALLSLFPRLVQHGTLIIISNLWDNPNGGPELDIDSNPRDIRIPRNEEKQKRGRNMEVHEVVQQKYHGYKTSLRQYIAILYKKLPENFSIVLRNKRVVHRDI
eukprot:1330944-Rhodomonas_salina.1